MTPDAVCVCGHTLSAHLGGQEGGECLRRPGRRVFCGCVGFRPVPTEEEK